MNTANAENGGQHYTNEHLNRSMGWTYENGVRVAAPHLRCQGRHWSGRQCAKIAKRGTRFCRSHAHQGASEARETREKMSSSRITADGNMSLFYSSVLGKTLKERVEEALEQPPHELMSAQEELALIKDQCRNVVQLYAGVVEAHALGKVDLETVVKAGGMLNEACAFVIEQVERVQKIDSQAPDKVPVRHLAHVVAQLCRIMWEVCGEDHVDIAHEFERLVREEVRLPKSGEQAAQEDGKGGVNVNVVNFGQLSVSGAQAGDPTAVRLAQSLGAATLLIDGAEVPVADLAGQPPQAGAVR